MIPLLFVSTLIFCSVVLFPARVDNTLACPILDLTKMLCTVAKLQTKSDVNVAPAVTVLSISSSSKPITLFINEDVAF